MCPGFMRDEANVITSMLQQTSSYPKRSSNMEHIVVSCIYGIMHIFVYMHNNGDSK